jgi:glycosyltransferase involved in cell wall biosynthesis
MGQIADSWAIRGFKVINLRLAPRLGKSGFKNLGLDRRLGISGFKKIK